MPVSGPDVLLYEKKGRIVTITLNRPERMNALSLELMERLSEAWRRFEADEDAWVAILTGAGDKAFSAGRDLKEVDEASRQGRPGAAPPRQLNTTPYGIWKPVIAAINGYALAGGFRLAMDCDIRLAAEHAEFGIPEARWNLSAGWAAFLPHQLNLAHALELLLWADTRMSARRGYEIGWLNRVVPKERLMAEAMAWAERMLSLAPRAVRNLKETLYRGLDMPVAHGVVFGRALEQNLLGMEDTVEGPRAFVERRQPRFKNR